MSRKELHSLQYQPHLSCYELYSRRPLRFCTLPGMPFVAMSTQLYVSDRLNKGAEITKDISLLKAGAVVRRLLPHRLVPHRLVPLSA